MSLAIGHTHGGAPAEDVRKKEIFGSAAAHIAQNTGHYGDLNVSGAFTVKEPKTNC